MQTAVSETERPLAHRFFKEALESRRLAHAYLLKGRAYGEMYRLALCIAQVLNCKNPPSPGEACGECTDCKWILANSHPAVYTISRMTYVTAEPKSQDDPPRLMEPDELEKAGKDGKWFTKIRTSQIGMLLQELSIKSEHKRVVIFIDAEELPASIPSEVIAPNDWRGLKIAESKSFHVRPLTRNHFNRESANRFLKTLEEPLPNTMFFFLTETEEQLLPTIVSRCQVVPYTSAGPSSYGAIPEVYMAFFGSLLSAYKRGEPDVYRVAGEFEQFFTEQGLSFEQALDAFQLYLRNRFLEGSPDAAAFARYRQAQLPIAEAQRMLHARTNEGQALLQLFLSLREPLRQF